MSASPDFWTELAKFVASDRFANTVSALTFLTVVVGGACAFIRYLGEVRWKRKEFVYELFQKLDENLLNRQAVAMLDWDERNLYLAHSTDDKLMTTSTRVNTALLVSALRKYSGEGRFSAAEARIRDIFDHWFTELSRIELFIQSGLVKFEDVEPHLEYMMALMAGLKHGPNEKWTAIRDYLEFFQYTNCLALMKRFNFSNLGPSSPQIQKAQ